MYLTKEEEKILNGEYGRGLAKAMQVIVSVGDSLNSEKLIVHSGVWVEHYFQ
jgi:predicted aconitase